MGGQRIWRRERNVEKGRGRKERGRKVTSGKGNTKAKNRKNK